MIGYDTYTTLINEEVKTIMSKRFLIILAVLFAAFVGFVVISKNKNDSQPTGSNSSGSQHVQGKAEKGVTLVEFGDFQCPSCAAYFPILKQVKTKYGNDIAFQFKHFPLTQIHPNAMAAHRAAEAAGKQKKFWEMHDLLYQRQQAWATQSNIDQILEDYATELGLNVEQYKQDFASAEVNAVINADIAAGNQAGATATPTFVINGKKVENVSPTLEAFSAIIDQAIREQSAS